MCFDLMKNEEVEEEYCVYKHTNTFNDKVYIGITCRDPKDRWNGGYGYYNNEYFWRAIKKYGWNDGFIHEILYKNLTYEEACSKEIELIAKYDSTNPKYGYNHHKGGKCCDYITRQKISLNQSRKKPVLQYAKDGTFISEYESRMSASKKTRIAVSDIAAACNGRILSAGGYFWCDKDNPDKINIDLDKYRSNMEHVLQFDLDGNIVCEYKNIYDASSSTGISTHDLSSVCFGNFKPLNDFLFCYCGKEYKVKRWIKRNNEQEEVKVNKRPKGRPAGPKRTKR